MISEPKGSVALEYVMTLVVGVVFLCCWLGVFTPGVGYTEKVGRKLVAYFQRVLVGLSLPIP
ncbi:MAG: hypothetical protein IJJ33_10430 [Victivallales bacterium]|nr:hypothetical protein [Victivallales bacterium]MBQ6472390.1 hypothetical protein [Victivallales bacterium]